MKLRPLRAPGLPMHQVECENCNVTDSTQSARKVDEHNNGIVVMKCWKCGVDYGPYKKVIGSPYKGR